MYAGCGECIECLEGELHRHQSLAGLESESHSVVWWYPYQVRVFMHRVAGNVAKRKGGGGPVGNRYGQQFRAGAVLGFNEQTLEIGYRAPGLEGLVEGRFRAISRKDRVTGRCPPLGMLKVQSTGHEYPMWPRWRGCAQARCQALPRKTCLCWQPLCCAAGLDYERLVYRVCHGKSGGFCDNRLGWFKNTKAP